MKSIFTALAFLMMATGANAQLTSSGEEFRRLVLTTQTQCPVISCSNSRIRMKTLSPAEVRNLTDETRDRLDVSANELSQIWGDTILEGDYYSDTEVHVEQIQELTVGQTMIGYRITYSAPAWETSNCDFRADDRGSFDKCQNGKIIESSFVSADFSSAFQDAYAPAIFAD